jgi:hypothetical protein
MSRAKKNWISGAIKKPGALRKTLHVTGDNTISEPKLDKALHSNNKLTRARANLAKNLKSFH